MEKETAKVKVGIYMPPELHKQLQMLRVHTGRPVSEQVTEAVIKYLKEMEGDKK